MAALMGIAGLFLVLVTIAPWQDPVLADSNKTRWVDLACVFGFFATFVYLALIRPKLTAVQP